MAVISGAKGIAKVGYHRAANIARWSLTTPDNAEALSGTKRESVLVAKITHLDMYWSTHKTFSVGLHMGKDKSGQDIWWVWHGIDVEGISQGTITASITSNPLIHTSF